MTFWTILKKYNTTFSILEHLKYHIWPFQELVLSLHWNISLFWHHLHIHFTYLHLNVARWSVSTLKSWTECLHYTNWNTKTNTTDFVWSFLFVKGMTLCLTCTNESNFANVIRVDAPRKFTNEFLCLKMEQLF